jgi:predicted nucleic acid-binding protein
LEKDGKEAVAAASGDSSHGRSPSFFDRLIPLGDLGARATEIAIELQHPIYDCFYLARAERERAPIVSADAKLLAAAKKNEGRGGEEVVILGCHARP